MPICNQTVELERLEFLDVTDEALADSLRRSPVTQCKKSYSRLEAFERILTVQGGTCCPTHVYTETTNTLSGFFQYPTECIKLESFSDLTGDTWCYVLLVPPGDELNWIGAIQIQEIIICGSTAKIVVRPLFRKIVAGAWVVSTTPFEEE